MASPASVEEFLDLVHKSGVADDKRVDGYVQKLRAAGRLPGDPSQLSWLLVHEAGLLTLFQAEHLMQGKWRRFTIGKYKVLEKLGSGGMGTVYLCEHKLMRCLRAIKILPAAKAQDEAALGRFYREARAVAAIDHPNIVHAYDIDQDESLHFLVMEYVDGSSLQDIVKHAGPLSITRACHYIRQSAIGLDHAQRAGLVHRDIKPGNILVARDGAVKILDLGLARFFNDEDDILTRKFDENVLGTADYLAPEQALDSHTVDTRADIYSLGATFYYMLTGKTPFGEGTVAQKLFWHQSRQPKPIRDLRADVPPAIEAIIMKMMAKDPAQRYQTPAELAEVLAPCTQVPIEAPPENEMPRLSPAATGKAGEGSHHDAASGAPISKPETPRALQKMGSTGSLKQGKPPVSAAPATVSTPATPAESSARNANGVKATLSAPPPQSAPASAPPSTPAAAQRPALEANIATQPMAEVEPEPAVEAEEEFAWQGLANETADLTAAAHDTTPSQKSRPGQPVAAGEERARTRERNIVLLLVALMGFAGCLGAVIGGGFWIYWTLTRPPDREAQAAQALIVSRQEGGKRPGVYRTIREALHVAPQGSVIEIADELVEENVAWPPKSNPNRSTEVTIQPAAGKQVTWRPKNPGEPILSLTNVTFFKLKGPGLMLDGDPGEKAKGKKKVKDLIYVIGSSQGLTVEEVELKNFDRSGICIFSAAGDPDNPIRITGITALSPPVDKDGAAIYIDARADMRIKQVDCIVVERIQAPGVPPAQVVRAGNGALGERLVRLPVLK